MAKKKRLSPKQLAKLKADFAGLKTIQNYRPAKAEFETAEVEVVDNEADRLLEQEAQQEAALSDTRNQIANNGTYYTQKMKGVRQQVIGQFGDDSPEYEAVGGVRTSNRKSGLHRGNGGNNNSLNR